MAASPLDDAVLATVIIAASIAVLVVVNLAVAHLWARHVARQLLRPQPDDMGEVRPRLMPRSDSDRSDRVRSAGSTSAPGVTWPYGSSLVEAASGERKLSAAG